ncbi:MAG: isopentenyl phosphate kinase [Candidatus Altiarchaeota archaeon]
MNLTILKLGGSLITRKSDDRPVVNKPVLKRLAREIAEVLSEKLIGLIIVHGAGPFGHVPAKKYGLAGGLKDRVQVRGMSLTHQGMEELNLQVVGALIDAGVNAIAFQPSAGGILDDRQLVSFPVESVQRLLELGLVPVAYGDVLPDLKTGFNILSGDHLVPYLAEKLAADRVVLATYYNGIFDRDPDEKGAKKYDFVNERILAELDARTTKGTDVTGGIGRKVRELMVLAKHGVKSEIISGMEPGYVKRALKGEEGIGTRIE